MKDEMQRVPLPTNSIYEYVAFCDNMKNGESSDLATL